jgi:hypothetical protein
MVEPGGATDGSLEAWTTFRQNNCVEGWEVECLVLTVCFDALAPWRSRWDDAFAEGR